MQSIVNAGCHSSWSEQHLDRSCMSAADIDYCQLSCLLQFFLTCSAKARDTLTFQMITVRLSTNQEENCPGQLLFFLKCSKLSFFCIFLFLNMHTSAHMCNMAEKLGVQLLHNCKPSNAAGNSLPSKSKSPNPNELCKCALILSFCFRCNYKFDASLSEKTTNSQTPSKIWHF